MKYQGLKAVAAISMGMLLYESAPVLIEGKRPNRINWILLTDTQRDKLSKWLELDSTDTRYQGKYDGALPQGFENIDNRYPQHWHNGGSQWVDAQKLHEYIEFKVKAGKYRDTNGMELLRELVQKASEL